MNVISNTIKEHDYCFSFDWCLKGDENIKKDWDYFLGYGRLMISKDGKKKALGITSPGINYIYHFELEIQNLEECWYLEIPYHKRIISKIKAALNCSTTQLLEMINNEKKIILTESKAWCDNYSDLFKIEKDLNTSGVECKIEVKVRKKKCY